MTLQPSWTGFIYYGLWVFEQDTRLRLGSFVMWDGGACYTKKYHLFEETSCLHLQDTRGNWPEYLPSCEYQISFKKHRWLNLRRAEQTIMCSWLQSDNTRSFSPCCEIFTRFSLDEPTDRTCKLFLSHVTQFQPIFQVTCRRISMQVEYSRFNVLR